MTKPIGGQPAFQADKNRDGIVSNEELRSALRPDADVYGDGWVTAQELASTDKVNKGHQGARGQAGATGAKGDRGATGATGAAGRDGVNGKDGLKALELCFTNLHP